MSSPDAGSNPVPGTTTGAEARALTHLLNEREGITPGTNVVLTNRDERGKREQPEVLVSSAVGDAPDWTRMDIEASANSMAERCRNGLPVGIAFEVKPDVMALYGFTMEMLDGAVREPERVEVRPESFHKSKRYPILGFYRADITVILGMRLPRRPAVIAAYAGSKLTPQQGRHMPGSGSGGTRKAAEGLPNNPRQLMNRMRGLGVELPDEIDFLAKAIEVKYRGESLGKVSIDKGTPRADVQSAYQRVVRKIQAIARKTA